MKLGSISVILCCGLALGVPSKAQAQYSTEESFENTGIVKYGNRYVDLNLYKYEKLAKRVENQQKQFVKRLQHKEKKLLRQLHSGDSAAYVRLVNTPLSYDSIGKLVKPGSSTQTSAKANRRVSGALDSLTSVVRFMKKAGYDQAGVDKYSGSIQQLRQQFSYRQYIADLITRHTDELIGLCRNVKASALTEIQQQNSYLKTRIATWQQIADDPEKLEQSALEYLQGVKGFDDAINNATKSSGGMTPGMTANDLNALGFQTKGATLNSLQQKFGNNIGRVQQQMAGEIGEWQSLAQGYSSNTKQALHDVKGAGKKIAGLHLNPLRGLPFCLRLEKQFGFTTARPSNGKPALLSLSGSIGYKLTRNMSFGAGVVSQTGLGQSWSAIQFSFQGVGTSAYARLKLMFGINGYASYERVWKSGAFTTGNTDNSSTLTPSLHNTSNYSESCLIGLEKQYKLSGKFNGYIQVLFDCWWKNKALRSPFQIRFVQIKI